MLYAAEVRKHPKVQQLGLHAPCQCWILWYGKANMVKGEETTIYLKQITDFWYIWIATLLYKDQFIILWSAAIQNT